MKISAEQKKLRAAFAKDNRARHIARRSIRISEREFVITAPRVEETEDAPDDEPGSLFDRR